VLAAVSLSALSARADEVSLKIDDGGQAAVMQMPALLDSCVAGVMMRGDAMVCKGVSNFLTAFGNDVKRAQAAAKAASDKAAADEAAKAAPPPAN